LIYLESRVCVEASVEKVWAYLSDLEKVNLWVPEIIEAWCPEGKGEGIHANRVCKLKGNITIEEEWLSWNELKSFSYIAKGMPIIKSATNNWELKEENGKTLVISKAEIDFGTGIMSKIFSYSMTPYMRKMGPRTLSLLKYWVEHDVPYKGKTSNIPPGPLAC